MEEQYEEQHESSWRDLPAGLLQAVAASLPWGDCLSARLACEHWAAALAPLVWSLRVHAAAGCSNVHAGDEGAPGGGVRQLLSLALGRFHELQHVQLVLSEQTAAADLASALELVGGKASVREVTLWEVAPVHGAFRPHAYAPALERLAALQHVEVLRVRSPVTWGLQEIWDQVANMSAGGRAPALAELHLLVVSCVKDKQTCRLPPPGALPGALRCLMTPLPGIVGQDGAVVCTAAQSHDQYLAGLAASLPGLTSLRVVGPPFQGQPALLGGLTELRALTICVGGQLRSFVGAPGEEEERRAMTRQLLGLGQLQQLELQPAEGMDLDVLDLGWLTPRMRHLRAALALPNGPLRPAREPLQLQSLSVKVTRSSELLEQVAALAGGQLTALALNTGPRPAVRHTRNPLHDPPLRRVSLQPHVASFSNLTSLEVVHYSQHLPPHCGFELPDPAAAWAAAPRLRRLRLCGVGLGYGEDGGPLPGRRLRMPTECGTLQSNILSLRLCEDQCKGELWDPPGLASAWRARVPGLRRARRLRRRLEGELALAQDRGWVPPELYQHLQLWLCDLPPGLEELELIEYVLFDCRGQCGRCRAAAAGGSRGSQQRLGACGGACASKAAAALGRLRALVLDGCCVVAEEAPDAADIALGAARRRRRSSSSSGSGGGGGSSSSDSSSGPGAPDAPPAATFAPAWQLLQHLGGCATGQLAELQLLGTPLCSSDIVRIARTLGAHLRRLHLQPGCWLWPRACPATEAFAALGAAAEARQLPQLRDLSVTLLPPADAGCPGIEALRQCAALTGLRRLMLSLDLRGSGVATGHSSGGGGDGSSQAAAAGREPGVALCSCGGPWGVSRLQHLAELGLMARVPRLQHWRSLGPGEEARCGACGGGVGLEAVRRFVKRGVPALLPACQVAYTELAV